MNPSTTSPGTRPARAIMKTLVRVVLGSIVIYALFGSGSGSSGSLSIIPGVRAEQGAVPVPVEEVQATPPGKHIVVDDDKVEEIPLGGEAVVNAQFDTEEDIDDFIAQLLAEEAGQESTGSEHPPPPPPPRKALTEEERAELQRQKDIETQIKRKDITERHERWEKRLQQTGEDEVDELLEKVRKLRQSVVDKMRNTPELFDLLKTMLSDGMAQVHKVEAYLRKKKEEGRRPDDEDGKARKDWEKVVEKISKKLDEKTVENTEILHNRFQEIMAKEKDLFENSAQVVRDLADEAQADLGMDYAWLDDVTTHDWTRYHKLKEEAKRFTEIFNTIFNSTHPEMDQNIVQVEMIQVQTALVRVAADIKEALDKVKLKGDMWLRGDIEKTGVDTVAEETATASQPDITLHLHERKEETRHQEL